MMLLTRKEWRTEGYIVKRKEEPQEYNIYGEPLFSIQQVMDIDLYNEYSLEAIDIRADLEGL